jgi:lipopolysaccharide/colanic/teichoic acid biosynthesis glycosyltransferase
MEEITLVSMLRMKLGRKRLAKMSNATIPRSSSSRIESNMSFSSKICDSRMFLSYERWKLPLERLLAFGMLVLAFPLIALLVLIVRLTSPGPGIFRQTRVGKDGKLFTLYKIRSMRLDAESAHSGPVWATAHDPRATKFGSWLRDAHLDELPQLLNVVRGEMSLVGPRPERPEFVEVLSQKVGDYEKRLDVLPGITGLAQINLPPDSDLESVRSKLRLDLKYIENINASLDFRLVLCTALTLFGVRGHAAARWLGLCRGNHSCTDVNGSSGLENAARMNQQILTAVAHSNTAFQELNADSVKAVSRTRAP